MVFIIPKPDGQTVLCLSHRWSFGRQARRPDSTTAQASASASLSWCPRSERAVTPGGDGLRRFPLIAEVPKTESASAGTEDLPETESSKPSDAPSLWAMLISRIYEILLLDCPRCGGELTIVAFLAPKPIRFSVS